MHFTSQTSQGSDNTSMMLISREKSMYKKMDAHKTAKGQFFTKRSIWLTQQVRDFITSAIQSSTYFVDPFAGEGHLLEVCKTEFGLNIKGLDIATSNWDRNDSLLSIPKQSGGIIVTNPPYLAKYSARRKGVYERVAHYYENHDYEDLYQLAIHRCLESSRFTVAIIPETFLNSNFPKKHLVSAIVLEENPFDDTETPVCVACFDNLVKNGDISASLYVNDLYCGKYGEVFRHRGVSIRNKAISFNDPKGNVAFRAVDSTDPALPIAFCMAEEFGYSRENIKVSSRLLTYIQVDGLSNDELQMLIIKANERLKEIRNTTCDLVLSPFKGNNREGKRRRRLDYNLARLILSESLSQIKTTNNQLF